MWQGYLQSQKVTNNMSVSWDGLIKQSHKQSINQNKNVFKIIIKIAKVRYTSLYVRVSHNYQYTNHAGGAIATQLRSISISFSGPALHPKCKEHV